MTELTNKRRSRKAGLPPGTLVYIGDKKTEKAFINIIDYNEAEVQEKSAVTPEECREYVDKSTVTWINMTGLHDTDILQKLGDVFGIHPLILEDIVNTSQRPKLEDYGDYLFLVFKMLYHSSRDGSIVSEQMSLVLGRNYVLSFQEIPGDIFDAIRERIRAGKGRIRKHGCDYLAYTLLDAVVDHYFVVLEDLGDRIDLLQEKVLVNTDRNIVHELHNLKKEVIFMRKNLWPLRELVSGLEKSESHLIHKTMIPYLRDVYEHTVQVLDTVESLRDVLSSVFEIYLSNMSNKMNETMKILTLIATIFIPLTFIAGVYGMNFENMPELKWEMGYAGVWIIMILTASGMCVFFKRKKWL